MDVIGDGAVTDGGVDDSLDGGHEHTRVGGADILLAEPSFIVGDGGWGYLREKDVTAEKVREAACLLVTHGGGGEPAVFAEFVCGISGILHKCTVAYRRTHGFQNVTELSAGVQVWVDDPVEALVVVVQDLPQFGVDKVGIRLVDYLSR